MEIPDTNPIIDPVDTNPIIDPIIPPPCVPLRFNITFDWVGGNTTGGLARAANNTVAMNQLRNIANNWTCHTSLSMMIFSDARNGTVTYASGRTSMNLVFNRAAWIQGRLMEMGVPGSAFTRNWWNVQWGTTFPTPGGQTTPFSTINIR